MGDMGDAGMMGAPLPQGDPSMGMIDPSMGMADPSMGGDPNAMGGDMGGMDDNGVDNKAEKPAGELSNILPNANEETVDYVAKMLTKAIANNPNIGDSNKKEYADNLTSGESGDDSEEQPQDQPQGEQPMQESQRRYSSLIDEALNEIFGDLNDNPKSRKEVKKTGKVSVHRNNPFVPNLV